MFEKKEIQALSWDGTYSQKAIVSGVCLYYVLALVNGAPKIYKGDLTLVCSVSYGGKRFKL